jgi:hypothetical protein
MHRHAIQDEVIFVVGILLVASNAMGCPAETKRK